MIDLQSNNDSRGISLNWVGISNYKHPIEFEGFNSIADVNFFVDLAGTQRAIHMSRLIEILQDFSVCNFLSLSSLLSDAQTVLATYSSRLELKFTYIIKKTSPITRKVGGVPYQCELACEKHGNNVASVKYKLHIPITSVCPCSKSISDYGAHNQRGIVIIEFISNEEVDIQEIITLIENCSSCEIYSILKRPDEKHVTEVGYNNAKFVEDIARDVILVIPEKLKVRGLGVIVENLESIHMHNAIAKYKVGVISDTNHIG